MNTIYVKLTWLNRKSVASIWAVAALICKIKQEASRQAPPFGRCCLAAERRRCCS